MKNKQGGFFLALAIAIISFLSITYYSCQKAGNAASCDGVVCINGGVCIKGVCMCPVGYEDSACSSPIVNKFLGTWNVYQQIIGSDSIHSKLDSIHGHFKDSSYLMTITSTATPTTFFMNDFAGNQSYNKVIGSIDGSNSYHFIIDSTVNYPLWFAPIVFYGGSGNLVMTPYPYDTSKTKVPVITATYVMKVVNTQRNYEKDTFKITMWKH